MVFGGLGAASAAASSAYPPGTPAAGPRLYRLRQWPPGLFFRLVKFQLKRSLASKVVANLSRGIKFREIGF